MNQDNWIGYDRLLRNGNNGSRSILEKFFNQGVVGSRNTTALYVEDVFERNGFVADENGDPMEDPPKIIYAHPSEVPYSPGTRMSASYSGGSVGKYNKRKIADSAVLFVEEDPPMTQSGLEDVSTFLAGDDEDENLRDRYINIQAYPFME